eukprot:14686696-Alexandrium_andersonii.AAC.1
MSTPSRIQALTEEMIKLDQKGPRFKGKGAEVRHLVPFAVELAESMHRNLGTVHTGTLVKMASALLDYYMTLSSAPFCPSQAAKAARNCCLLYSSLHREAVVHERPLLWKVTPKFHLFVELAEYQTTELGNPRLFGAYKDEDFVGWIADFAASRGGACHCC